MGNFTAASLFASLTISSVGLGLAGYGKKMARIPQLVAGLVLVVYPYFVPAVVPMVAIAAGVLVVMLVALRAGH